MTEIAGVPSQFFQDALTVILEATPPHFSIEGSHCGGNVVGWAVHEGDCYPLIPDPTWVCQTAGLDYVSGLSHRGCFKQNLNIQARNCSCTSSGGWVYTSPDDGNKSLIIPYYNSENSTNKSFCAVCADDHGKNPPCQFCGEVHD